MELTSPPLIVSPTFALDEDERKAFVDSTAKIADIEDGQVVACPFPIALHHRIDGIWLSVSDLGSFHDAPPAQPARKEPAESTYVPPEFVPCDDEEED